MTRAELLLTLVDSIKAFQDSVDRFDTAAASHMAVNETDLRCLVLLADRGQQRPSELAELLGLTRGATTTALGRLEAAGHLEREDDTRDGRSHYVRLTASAQERMSAIWKPIRERGAEVLDVYSDKQLRLLIDFMSRSVTLHEECESLLLAPKPPMDAKVLSVQ